MALPDRAMHTPDSPADSSTDRGPHWHPKLTIELDPRRDLCYLRLNSPVVQPLLTSCSNMSHTEPYPTVGGPCAYNPGRMRRKETGNNATSDDMYGVMRRSQNVWHD